MSTEDSMLKSVDSAAWQDFRASNTGMVVYYTSDPVSEKPIREVPEEIPSEVLPEPNYETGTYGFYGCAKSKIRTAFVKAKLRYLFFVTKYAGTNVDFKDKIVITGYYRVTKVSDVKKQHIRYLTDYSCLDEDICYALRAEEVKFVSLEDAFVITNEVLKSWNYNARITRQTRIIIDENATKTILDYFQEKENDLQTYVDETLRLQPHGSISEQEDGEPEE